MMKSIRTQFLLSYILIIVIFVAITLIANLFFLEPYYISKKLGKLESVSQRFEGLWGDKKDSEILDYVFKVENTDAISFEMIDVNGQVIYSTRAKSNNISNVPFSNFNQGFSYWNRHGQLQDLLFTPDNLKKLEKGDVVRFQLNDDRNGTNLLGIAQQLSTGELLILMIPITAIQESVATLNEFIIWISIILLIFGWLWSIFYSNRLTKPIRELKDIALQLSKLNFSQEWKSERKDELGSLGESMNELSVILGEFVSEIQQKNTALQKELDKKDQLERMRKEFISDVSHELKSPIAIIQGYGEGLLYNVNQDTESQLEYSQVIIDEAKKMNILVNDLLLLSKIESGHESLDVHGFDIHALIQKVVSKHRNVSDAEVVLGFENTPCMVFGDENKIEQVITNYVTNAFKYGSDQGLIKIHTRIEREKLYVGVYNTGEAISEDDLQNIWLSFYKIDKARTREVGGVSTGLGLSIVKKIMDLHEEEYGVCNEEKGVEFYFTLPIQNKWNTVD